MSRDLRVVRVALESPMINDTTAGRWFRRVMWLGIFANLALALPTIAAPDFMIDRVGLTGLFLGQTALFALVIGWMLVAPQFRALSPPQASTYRSGPAPHTVVPDA